MPISKLRRIKAQPLLKDFPIMFPEMGSASLHSGFQMLEMIGRLGDGARPSGSIIYFRQGSRACTLVREAASCASRTSPQAIFI